MEGRKIDGQFYSTIRQDSSMSRQTSPNYSPYTLYSLDLFIDNRVRRERERARQAYYWLIMRLLNRFTDPYPTILIPGAYNRW